MIFVVDSADKLRICVAKNELAAMLNHPGQPPFLNSLNYLPDAFPSMYVDMARIPILFFSNKMDIPGAYNFIQVAEAMALDDIVDRPWTIVSVPATTWGGCVLISGRALRSASNALTGQGLNEGVDWLIQHVTAS